jgi:hypothetical protein
VLRGPPGATRLRELVRDRVGGLLLVPGPPDGDPPPTGTPLVVVVPPGTPSAPGVTDGSTVVRDDTGVLAAAYCPGGVPAGGLLVVVRPDWHIAARRQLTGTADLAELDELADRACGCGLPRDT